jgi:sulfofructose kinase
VVKRRPRIICAGLAVMDQIFTVERLPDAPRKHFATSFHEIGGGPAANAAVAVARLGGEARLWSRVGDDLVGDRIVRELEQEGVTVAGIQRIPGARSGCSAILVDTGGERMIVNFRGDRMDPDPGWLPLSEIHGAGAVLGDLRWPEGSARALAEARRLGIPALLDADAAPKREGAEALAVADHILFSSQGLAEFTGLAGIEDALRLAASRTGAWVGVSAGQDGVYWMEGEQLRHQPSFAVDVVDTLGAGDVLHGAFALAIAGGDRVDRALRFACGAAAIKCTRPGGRTGAPSADEVATFLEERGDGAAAERSGEAFP